MSNFTLYAPIDKVDKENRTVAGWATDETLDKQGEIVSYLASKEAFADWPGNIREQHDSKAVGKAVEIIPNDEKKAIYVKAYISKGSPETWEKILDGTLRGYSIGGNTLDKSVQIVKDVQTGQSRQVTKINKYRLNELSLVDNPANPSSIFSLVKRANDGYLYQTELVEDIQKVIITDSDFILENEVKEYREKADGLARKIRTSDEMEKMGDDEFGIIRKYVSPQGNKVVKERHYFMPDKVHANAVLRKLDEQSITPDERNVLHKKAKEILGSSHSEDECKFCKSESTNTGGDSSDMDKAVVTELTGKIDALCTTIDKMLKAYEGAYKPVAGAKDTPEQEGENPTDASISPSSPDKTGDPDNKDVKTQDEQPVPAKKNVGASNTKKAQNPATSNAETQESPAVPAGTGKAESVSAKDGVPAASSPEKAGDPAKNEVKTQDEQPVPAKKAMASKPAEGSAEEEASETPEEEAAEQAGTKKAVKKAKPAEGSQEEEDKETEAEEMAEEGAKKSADPSDLKKLVATVQTLQKEVETLKKQPLPRKYAATRIEKSNEEPSGEDTLQKEYNEVLEWIKAHPGKDLPREIAIKKDAVLNKMLSNKFGDSTKKVM